MATNHTENLGLSQFLRTDGFCMDDFNEDNKIIDEALAAGCKIATGSYEGTGVYGKANANTLAFDFTPRLVVITNSYCSGYPAAFVYGSPKAANKGGSYAGYYVEYCTWDETSLTWYNNNSFSGSVAGITEAGYQLNASNFTYYYVAIGD